MALDGRHLQTLPQVALTLSDVLRRRRETEGRRAWSDAEEAARRHDESEALAEPSVRLINADERQEWDRRVGEHTGQTSDRETESLSVRIGPLIDSRWAVHAELRPTSPDDPTQAQSVHVSCESQETAQRLADQLVAAGPDRELLRRIGAAATSATQRYETASRALHEPEEQRLARAASAVRALAEEGHWSAELAQRGVTSEAFGALAYRLSELEVERGEAMQTVLGEISQRRLTAHWVRDPAALASHFVVQRMANPLVVEGETVESPPAARREHSGGANDPADREAQERAAARRAEREASVAQRSAAHAEADAVIGPALNRNLPQEVCDALRQSRSYEWLVETLYQQHSQGVKVEETLLNKLPAMKIREANDPARYLHGVVRKRAETQRAMTERAAELEPARTLVREAFEGATAQRIIECPAFPRLAKQIAEIQQQTGSQPGRVDVAKVLAILPAQSIHDARKPAAYTRYLLDTRIRSRHVSTDGQAPASRQRATAPPRPVPARQDDLGAASATYAAGVEDAIAADHELRAAEERATAEHSVPDLEGNDQAGLAARAENEDAAAVDDNLAAAHRAEAAEELGVASAAAQRAGVTYTPIDATASADTAAQKTGRPIKNTERVVRPRTSYQQDRSPKL
jgi:hypothetical protein